MPAVNPQRPPYIPSKTSRGQHSTIVSTPAFSSVFSKVKTLVSLGYLTQNGLLMLAVFKEDVSVM